MRLIHIKHQYKKTEKEPHKIYTISTGDRVGVFYVRCQKCGKTAEKEEIE